MLMKCKRLMKYRGMQTIAVLKLSPLLTIFYSFLFYRLQNVLLPMTEHDTEESYPTRCKVSLGHQLPFMGDRQEKFRSHLTSNDLLLRINTPSMKIYKTKKGIVINHLESYFLLEGREWDKLINQKGLYSRLLEEIKNLKPDPSLTSALNDVLAPIGNQEIWASGVTYMRSREARMEESKDGGDFYARVYEAQRPELFFKAPAFRTVGPGQEVRIRKDSNWNVPEPELTLFMCSAGTIEGYTAGNDMSSRDIEGENPLYLPQAKSYDSAAAVGPCLFVPEAPINPDTMIKLEILRDRSSIFQGEISINRMKRSHKELAEYLFRENSFPHGAYLMTGTGIVPPDSFTLKTGDEVRITIEGIGTLINTVKQ